MSRQFLLRMLAVLVVGSGLASVAPAEDQKAGGDGGKPARLQIQVLGEEGKKGEGLVFQLGETSGYWIGVAVEQEDGRLEVEQVLPDSPAAKAGIKPDDLLLASGETPLKQPADLQKLVQSSGGKPLKLKIQRGGKQLAVEVTPQRREGVQTIVIEEEDEAGKGDKEQLRKRLQQLTDQVRKQAEEKRKPGASGWQVLNAPGAASNVAFPENLEITIKKKGNKPARIKVRQDAQTWTVSENELHKLPESIRGHVARMLPGRAAAAGVWLRPGAPLNPAPAKGGAFGIIVSPGGAPGQPVAGASVSRQPSRETKGDLEKEVQQLKHQLHELREQVEALRREGEAPAEP